jgi:hypothetical protein
MFTCSRFRDFQPSSEISWDPGSPPHSANQPAVLLTCRQIDLPHDSPARPLDRPLQSLQILSSLFHHRSSQPGVHDAAGINVRPASYDNRPSRAGEPNRRDLPLVPEISILASAKPVCLCGVLLANATPLLSSLPLLFSDHDLRLCGSCQWPATIASCCVSGVLRGTFPAPRDTTCDDKRACFSAEQRPAGSLLVV